MQHCAALKKGWVRLLARHRPLKQIRAGGLVEARRDTKKAGQRTGGAVRLSSVLKKANVGNIV